MLSTSLMVFLLFTCALANPNSESNPCPPKANITLSSPQEETLSLASQAVASLPSPTVFTRKGHKVVEGAVYDATGNVVCIRKDDPAAYLYNPEQSLSRKTLTVAECDAITTKSTKLTVPNGDLMNRLIWSAGEGTCNAIDGDVTLGKKIYFSSSRGKDGKLTPVKFGTYYHGFAFNNLVKKHGNSEERMLRKACRDNSGPIFDSYFLNGKHLNVKDYFNLLLTPSKWVDATADNAYRSYQAPLKIKHCLSALLPSLVPGAPDPTDGAAAFWANTEHGAECTVPRFNFRFWMGEVKSRLCFRP